VALVRGRGGSSSKRPRLDIDRAVHTEVLSAGAYYYGAVTPEAVRGILDKAVERGALRLQ
jgi:hypothetical protein